MKIFGKTIVTKRKVAWYAQKPFEYSYSNSTKKAHFWTQELLEIKTIVQKLTNEEYNSCLLNLYHDGNEGMYWHSDNEKEIEKHSSIASISFGVQRKFQFKHNETNERIEVFLENGSLLEMKGLTQSFWKHQIPKSKKIISPRINLTYRKIIE